jgi:hypothetical protein
MILKKGFIALNYLTIIAVLIFFPCKGFFAAEDLLTSVKLEILHELPVSLHKNTILIIDLITIFKTYPNYLKRVECTDQNHIYLVMRDGTKILYEDHISKTFNDKLNNPDIEDMLFQVYPLGKPENKTQPDYDPGRIRVNTFFNCVYGSNSKQVRSNLVSVKFAGITVRFNFQNGAATALKKVGETLKHLLHDDPSLRGYLFPISGTYNRRTIAGTNRLSPHSWGIAIDLNPKKASYWRWSNYRGISELLKIRIAYPLNIISSFEDQGFIWGGKWFHYDTMHFEYRPELVEKAKLMSALNR